MKIAVQLLLAALLALGLAAGCAGGSGKTVTLYAAPDGDDAGFGTKAKPLASLDGARQAAAKARAGNPGVPVTVLFAGGLYEMAAPVVFGPGDSGTPDAPVTYAAMPGETPILSGGRIIGGWREENGRWVTEIPAVKDGSWHFNQLFVNGEPRNRARIPNEGFLRVAGFPGGTAQKTDKWPQVSYHASGNVFQYAPGDMDPNWHNLTDIEVIVYRFWTDSHMQIASIDADKCYVTFTYNADKVFTDDFTTDGARYFIDNVYEGMDAPGEWYLDRTTGVLTYIPKEGETLAQAEIVAPVIPELLRFEGKPMERSYVGNLVFSGLSFQFTNWRLPPGNANDAQGSSSVPAAITGTGLQSTTFEGCTVKNTGTWAFELKEGCSDNIFSRNEISYVAAGGFRINGGGSDSHPLVRTGSNEISDNHLHHYGEVYPSAVGVLLMNTNGNLVSHNEIDHGWYTGISVGWSWGYQRSVSRDNIIEYNHIHDIGQTGLLSDMGGIYTLGVSPGTVLRYNHIHDVNANQYGGWGIYNDEGSTHILIENNVVHDTKFAGYNIHYAKEVTVRNNIFAFSRFDELSLGRVEPHVSCYFEGNIVYWTEGKLMASFKQDGEYDFHYSPYFKGKGSRTIECDWNMYWMGGAPVDSLKIGTRAEEGVWQFEPPGSVKIGDRTFADWQASGRDTHSVFADPKFVDAEKRDFRLQPDSPAYAFGFKDIDISTAGPRAAQTVAVVK